MSKTIIITGATSGIGEAAAYKIAEKGYNIILVARNSEKGKSLVEKLKDKFPKNEFSFYQANFSSIKETKRVADDILKDFNHVDVLLNNAGGVFSKFILTEEGYEKTLATNHLAYFIFTLKLIPIINKDEGRIVNVASNSHYKCTMDFESFTKEKDYFIMKAYGQSKLANIMFTYSLVDRLSDTNIKVNCLNPGRVKTKIGGKAGHWIHRLAWKTFMSISGISLEKGIRTHVFLATDEKAKDINGQYYNNMVLEKSNPESYDKEIQEKLWKWSEKATGINWKSSSN